MEILKKETNRNNKKYNNCKKSTDNPTKRNIINSQ